MIPQKIFIIGPIEPNIEALIKSMDESVQLFGLAAMFLEEKFTGAEIVNPHYIHEEGVEQSFIELHREDICAMLECDLAVVIPGSDQSRSAQSKIIIAQEWQLPLSELKFKQGATMKQFEFLPNYSWYVEYIPTPRTAAHKFVNFF